MGADLGLISHVVDGPWFRMGRYCFVSIVGLHGMDSPDLRTGFQVHTTRRSDPVGYVCTVFPMDVRNGLLCQSPYCCVVNDGIVRTRLSDCWDV